MEQQSLRSESLKHAYNTSVQLIALSQIHARRVTIMQRDIQLARRIRGVWGGVG
jgi:histone H3/H4